MSCATALNPGCDDYPLLRVCNLRVEFPTRRAALRAIDRHLVRPSCRARSSGVVGESGTGKSVAGAAIIGPIDAPGRIASSEILLDGQPMDQASPGRDAEHPRQT
jgi:peptide/nickel transport system ATP-binding protein